MVDRSLLNKATSPDETPTPGYMFGEIAKATFADINASQQLADYLLKKLERDNPHVKLKVLRIIRHVCDQGKMDFRRAVQKKAELVKQCQQYRGTPDPLKGDAPNKAVREEADAALKSIFSSDASIDAFGRSIDQGRKMQGFGSGDTSSNTGGGYGGGGNASFGGGGGMGGSSFGGSGQNSAYGGGGGGPAGKKMEGFGNGPPPPEDMGQGVGAVKEVFNSTVSAISKWTSKAYGTPNSPPSLEETTGAYRAPNIQNDHAYGGGSGGGGGGGGFGAGVQGRFGPSGQTSQPLSQQRPAPQHSTGDYEARVVGELCAPGGARVAPTAAVLEDFCRKCESLDPASVGDQLRQKLTGTEWQTRLKALHAIEALHNNNMDGIVGHLIEHASDLIIEAQDIPQCRQKASKVLYLMGLIDQPDEAPAKPRSGAGAAPAPAPSTMDLLDMDGGDAGVPAPAPAASQGPSDDLLGGGGLLGDSSQAPAPQADAPGNDLGGLTLTGDAPPPATTDASSGPSLLATLQGQAQAQPSQATDSQMLGELNIGGAADASQQQQQPSLLGQLNGGACNTYQAPNMSAPPPQPMDNQRGSHLNVLSGGPGNSCMGPGMMQGSPGMMMPNMQSGPCYPGQMQPQMPQQQNFGVPYGQPPLGPGQGMPCQQPAPCPGMYPGMCGADACQAGQQPGAMDMQRGSHLNALSGAGGMGCNMGSGMAPPMGPAMMSPGMMQPGMPQQQCGGQCGGMGGPCGGPMQPSGFGQPFGQSGPAGGPSSAFGFVGGAAGPPQGQPQSCPGLCGQGCPGCASTGLNSRPANDNNAFSFVADEMRRS